MAKRSGKIAEKTTKKAKRKSTKKRTTKRKRRAFTPEQKAKIIAAIDAAPRGTKAKVCKQYGVLQTQVSGWRTKGFGKKTKKRASTGRRTKASGKILSNYKQVKAALLARKRELEAELTEIDKALKA